MPAAVFATDGSGKKYELGTRGFPGSDGKTVFKVSIAVPSTELDGSTTVSNGCAVGLDGDLAVWLAPGQSLNDVKTKDLSRIVWRDVSAKASYLSIVYFVDEVLTESE